MFYEIPVFNANSVDPDQMQLSVASDLGLHYLPMSILWDAWHKWVNIIFHAVQTGRYKIVHHRNIIKVLDK